MIVPFSRTLYSTACGHLTYGGYTWVFYITYIEVVDFLILRPLEKKHMHMSEKNYCKQMFIFDWYMLIHCSFILTLVWIWDWNIVNYLNVLRSGEHYTACASILESTGALPHTYAKGFEKRQNLFKRVCHMLLLLTLLGPAFFFLKYLYVSCFKIWTLNKMLYTIVLWG